MAQGRQVFGQPAADHVGGQTEAGHHVNGAVKGLLASSYPLEGLDDVADNPPIVQNGPAVAAAGTLQLLRQHFLLLGLEQRNGAHLLEIQGQGVVC